MADEVGAHLRDLILTGRVRPGERVDQQALSDELHVSRSPIREALVVLAQEGLVQLSPNRGAFVADITQADIAEHYEVFGTISGRTASLAAEQLSDSQLADLGDIHLRFESGDPVIMSKANTEFHRVIKQRIHIDTTSDKLLAVIKLTCDGKFRQRQRLVQRRQTRQSRGRPLQAE